MSVADFHARQRQRRLSTCRHFTGVQSDACSKGVAYREVRDESTRPFGFPCTGGTGTCALREPVSAKEVDAEDALLAKLFWQMAEAREVIVSTGQPSGAVDCVACGKTDGLRFSVSSYNGHVHAACSTPNCLRWME